MLKIRGYEIPESAMKPSRSDVSLSWGAVYWFLDSKNLSKIFIFINIFCIFMKNYIGSILNRYDIDKE